MTTGSSSNRPQQASSNKPQKAATNPSTTRPQKTLPDARQPAGSSKNNSTLTLVILWTLLILGLVYVATGADPLNLFEPGEDVVVTANPGTDDPTPVSAGPRWQVFFTDPTTINDPNNLAGSIPEKLIERINAAQKSIYIAAFEFNLTPVAEALIAAKKRGVDVRWVTDDINGLEADETKDRGQFAMLKKARIKIIDDGRGALMHNKFIIFDNQVVWTGSANLTVNDNFRNNNNVIVFDSPEIAAIYEREFSEMWDGQFGPRSPSTVDQQSVNLDGMPVQVLFSPEDNVLNAIIKLVESAKKSIYFMAFSYTFDDLEIAMQTRGEAGVDLKGIFETRASETEHSALPMLFCAGFPVRQDGNPGTFHHKVIIIDGKTVVTGSLNFSQNADRANDENTVIVTSTQVARLYKAEFDRRWAEARDPDPAKMGCR